MTDHCGVGTIKVKFNFVCDISSRFGVYPRNGEKLLGVNWVLANHRKMKIAISQREKLHRETTALNFPEVLPLSL
ncbi:hypothetical protein NIES4073_54480 [Kalymmatonema gypsitolerans NIES-4073]|nr:hypothetical protein NIES4073_54480 [Scytonema sp. NIES-4073]